MSTAFRFVEKDLSLKARPAGAESLKGFAPLFSLAGMTLTMDAPPAVRTLKNAAREFINGYNS